MKRIQFSLLCWFLLCWFCLGGAVLSHAQAQADLLAIRINQLGYYVYAPKIAVVAGKATDFGIGTSSATPMGAFYIRVFSGGTLGDTVFTGTLGPVTASSNSSVYTRKADFSTLTRPGLYQMAIAGLPLSYPFRIGEHVLDTVSRAVLKGYYFQRSAMPLDPAWAGKWSRPAGHPDNRVEIHSSAASAGRPAGSFISASGGWYDAGDYNKYIVNSGITMGTLLDAYEDFSGYYDTLHTNIPEGADGVPDILNEVLYNLRWMLTMQDPADGGVYHKCTNAAFDGMVMPGVTKLPRYVVQKGTAATLDFAAVMAQAARVFKKFPTRLPGLADSCMQVAIRAWKWAEKNPDLQYDQSSLNKLYVPPITTGTYGDRQFRDEWFWAAAELWVDTREPVYEKVLRAGWDMPMQLPSWSDVSMMGVYTLLRIGLNDGGSQQGGKMQKTNKTGSDHIPDKLFSDLKDRYLVLADHYVQYLDTAMTHKTSHSNAFYTVMGNTPADFVWGSNAVAANQGMLLIKAWLLTRNAKYLYPALSNLDYLLGRNATGYCFVTGLGSHPPMHPHHRPSIADGIADPVPGLLVGGPNPGRQDHQHYAFTEPETAYADLDGAYASNEIAINWNAPLVYLAGAFEALQGSIGY